ncbi:uncharacterized protein LOC120214200 [Hibiscus syriacus]|nr:uncharacterized protein LOC120214200 [Hibiscus syriacus]
MDRLRFHQTILHPQPFSLFPNKTLKPQQPYSESPLSSRSESSLAEDNISASISPLTPSEEEEEGEEEKVDKRAGRGSVSSRSRSHSSSPSAQKNQRNHIHRHSSTSCAQGGKLKKSTNCKSLKELELEEVKGFMDLGFIFKKEHLDSRMINVVPGLLRLEFFETESNLAADELRNDDIMRPYLSEAWLIKRPDSPLLNLKLPRVTAAADMKKHLKCWAQTVAYVVQQQCQE